MMMMLELVISIKVTTFGWFKSHLSVWFLVCYVNEESYSHTRVSHGVPQGSVLGLIARASVATATEINLLTLIQ